jgi:Transcription termination factor nusG
MSDGILPWFAIRVKSRHEKSVSHLFTLKGLESFLPLYKARHRWVDRTKNLDLPLFPGYVFCRMDPHVRLPVMTYTWCA